MSLPVFLLQCLSQVGTGSNRLWPYRDLKETQEIQELCYKLFGTRYVPTYTVIKRGFGKWPAHWTEVMSYPCRTFSPTPLSPGSITNARSQVEVEMATVKSDLWSRQNHGASLKPGSALYQQLWGEGLLLANTVLPPGPHRIKQCIRPRRGFGSVWPVWGAWGYHPYTTTSKLCSLMTGRDFKVLARLHFVIGKFNCFYTSLFICCVYCLLHSFLLKQSETL